MLLIIDWIQRQKTTLSITGAGRSSEFDRNTTRIPGIPGAQIEFALLCGKPLLELYRVIFFDKTTMSLYMFLSGPKTGKSRNASELSNITRKCFDGSFYEKKNAKLATQIKNAFVFHVSLKDFRKDECPWRAIGSRMLLQLLQKNGNINFDDIYAG